MSKPRKKRQHKCKGITGVPSNETMNHRLHEMGTSGLSQADRDRIAGRRWAEEVLHEVEDEGNSDAFRAGFWREIRRRVKLRKPSKTVMSDRKSREFGRRVVEFGKFRGQRYDDVPLDYLEWLADQGTELQAYLESRRVKEERDKDA